MPAHDSASAREWPLSRRIGFRFLFSYLVLFNVPQYGSASIFDLLPWGAGFVNGWLAKPMQPLALWLGQRVFHLHGIAATFHETGSGDTALNYVLVLLCLCLALLATFVWSLLDRGRRQYIVLEAWLRLFLSLTVAVALLEYGFAKIFPSQFGPVAMSRLNETYGESSPMALIWTFMQGSRWYTMFGGVAELIAGVILFFRRTRTLGALLGGAVLLNIVMLNFCYDVPVKLYSTHLLLMCVYLAWPDLTALVRLFVFRGQAQLRTDHVPAADRRWINRIGHAMLGLALVAALVASGMSSYAPYPVRDTGYPLEGQWTVVKAESTVPGVPWREVLFDQPGRMIVRQVDGTSVRLKLAADATRQTLAATSKKFGDSTFRYATDPADPRHVTLTGGFNKGSVRFDLRRRSPDQYTLLTRGFHWINETTPNF